MSIIGDPADDIYENESEFDYYYSDYSEIEQLMTNYNFSKQETAKTLEINSEFRKKINQYDNLETKEPIDFSRICGGIKNPENVLFLDKHEDNQLAVMSWETILETEGGKGIMSDGGKKENSSCETSTDCWQGHWCSLDLKICQQVRGSLGRFNHSVYGTIEVRGWDAEEKYALVNIANRQIFKWHLHLIAERNRPIRVLEFYRSLNYGTNLLLDLIGDYPTGTLMMISTDEQRAKEVWNAMPVGFLKNAQISQLAEAFDASNFRDTLLFRTSVAIQTATTIEVSQKDKRLNEIANRYTAKAEAKAKAKPKALETKP